MALTTCPDCRGQRSTPAKTCPTCGRTRTAARAPMPRWQTVVAILVTGLVGMGLMAAVPQYALFWLLAMVGAVVWLAARSRAGV